MATKLNKTILEADEFMGFSRQPLGPLGYTYQLPFAVSAWAFNPDLNEEELDKAVSLFSYMLLGDGFITTTHEVYNLNKDLSEVIRAIRWPYANKFLRNDPRPGRLIRRGYRQAFFRYHQHHLQPAQAT